MYEQKRLKVGLHNFKPLVYQEHGQWTGFEVELWEYISKELNIQNEYIENKSFPDLLSKTATAEYDVAIAGITRTTEREEKLDMSFFTLDTGLGIAALPVHTFSLRDMFSGLFAKQTVYLLLLLVLFSFVTANIYWFIERGNSVSMPYLLGLFESIWWSIVTFSTVGYGDISPVTLAGRIFGIISIISGLAIFGLYIGQLSASLTLSKVKTKIKSADDLLGKKVGVKKGTTAIDAVKGRKAISVEYATLESAYDALDSKHVDAVVADLPVLQDAKKQRKFEIVGERFARQAYAFVLPKSTDEELLQSINRSLLKCYESGDYEHIYNKYFEG